MTLIKTKSISLIDEQISIIFNKIWYQEDITALQHILLENIPNLDIKEITHGADRENIRFLWRNAHIILNFDYYSQSCWFNAQDEMSSVQVQPLYRLLKNNL